MSRAAAPMGRAATAMLRAASGPTALTGGLLAALAALVSGTPGALGAVAGCAVVAGFFGLDLVAARVVARLGPDWPVHAAVLGYVAKVVALGVLLVVFRNTAALDRIWVAVSAIACAVVWLVAQVRAFDWLQRQRGEAAPERPPGSDR
jgi:ATP synthase protein I